MTLLLCLAWSVSGSSAYAQRTVGWRIDGGWRYTVSGHSQLERAPDTFRHGFNLGAGILAGESGSVGFYGYVRADGYRAPGYEGFPLAAQARVGLLFHTMTYDDGRRQSSRSTTNQTCYYGLGYCVNTTRTTTTHWQQQPQWIPGLLYLYVGGRYVHDTLGDEDTLGQRSRVDAAAVTGGMGYQQDFGPGSMNFFFEAELQRYLAGWDSRSRWGVWGRLGIRYGPAFVDIIALLDAAVGGELSLGAGFWFGT